MKLKSLKWHEKNHTQRKKYSIKAAALMELSRSTHKKCKNDLPWVPQASLLFQ